MILLKIRTSKTTKVFSVLLVLAMINTMVSPKQLFALTGGPTQPEVASFEPFSTNQMVDLFSGDFTYNIPLFELPGPNGSYPFNLAYHSGVSMDQEASWVGLGWTLNPGAINRTVRGFPDDFKGEELMQTLDQKPNNTYGYGMTMGVEIFGADLEKLGMQLNLSSRYYYNNYRGFGYGIGLGLALGPADGNEGVGLNLGLDLDSQSGATVSGGLSVTKNIKGVKSNFSAGISLHSSRGLGLSLGSSVTGYSEKTYTDDNGNERTSVSESSLGATTNITFADKAFNPSMSYQIEGVDLTGYFKMGADFMGIDGNIGGSIFWSTSYLKDRGDRIGTPVYGYNYMDVPFNNGDNEEKERYLLDFKREQDGTVTPKTPNLAMTNLTYDYYNIQGQGVGGMFRPYYSKIGHVHEPYARSANYGGSVGIDLGAGQAIHLGFAASYSQSVNKTLDWTYSADNNFANFYNYKQDYNPNWNPLYEDKYYKVHGENTVTYPTEKKLRVPVNTPLDYIPDVLNPILDMGVLTEGKIYDLNDELDGGAYLVDEDMLNYYSDGELAYIFGEEAVAPLLERKGIGFEELFNPLEAISYVIDHTEVVKTHDAGYLVMQDENGRLIYADASNPVSVEMHTIPGVTTNVNLKNNSRFDRSRMMRNSTVVEHLNSEIGDLSEFNIKYTDATDVNPSLNQDFNALIRAELPKHHIGGFSTIATDGRRYVYGLPAYNNVKKEKLYSVYTDRPEQVRILDHMETLVKINKTESSYDVSGSDEFKSITETPPYAYAYLLTSVLGSDYVDSDEIPGPSEGDMGYWVKFNYKKHQDDYGWRSPYEQASFIPGLESFESDDKASYLYGEKEIYYLESVETSTHIAVFETEVREDGLGATETSGGQSLEDTQLRLKEIKLFTQKEYDSGSAAVPIKTVHLTHDYELTQGVLNSNATQGGKLTLQELYFTYKNSLIGEGSKYKFDYQNNYPYKENAYDRWGNYISDNSISDYEKRNLPYTKQFDLGDPSFKSTKDKEASAWHLNKITMPSGGEININYESDDYAYVQHRKATQMFKILGVNDLGLNEVYDSDDEAVCNNRIYFQLENPGNYDGTAADEYEFKQRYLEPLKYGDKYQLYYKIRSAIREPGESDLYKEWLTGYAELDVSDDGWENNKWGIVNAGSSNAIGYVTVKDVNIKNKAYHPFAVSAWQFIRSVKPELLTATSMSNSSSTSNTDKLLKIKSLLSVFNSLALIFKSYTKRAYKRNWGSEIDLNSSVIRLGTPDGIKLGGGNRVKSITINDKHNSMYGDGEDFIQGQHYDYTIEEEGNIISSGVANYEPMIGGDENPLKHAKFYTDGVKFKTPDKIFFEYPINESYYPGASVGYRKVTVTPISSYTSAPTETDVNFSGISEYEFYTAKDFPVFTGETDIQKKRYNLMLPLPLIGTIQFQNQFATQGYKIVLNNMHGKPKSEMHYAQDANGNRANVTGGLEYEYNTKKKNYDGVEVQEVISDIPVLADTKPMMSYKNESNAWVQDAWKLPTDNMWLGVEHEFFMDNRNVRGYSLTAGLDVNTENLIFGPVVLPAFVPWPNFNFSYKELGTISTNKVISKTGVLKRTIVHTEGAQRIQENVLYDKTGEVLLTKTSNSFEAPVYNYNMPAYKVYENMGASYQRQGLTFGISTIEEGDVAGDDYYNIDLPLSIVEHLKEGDRIIVKLKTGHHYGDENMIVSVEHDAFEAWVTEVEEDGEDSYIVVNTDQDLPTLIQEEVLKVKTISGKLIIPVETNQLSAKVSSITALKNPTHFEAVNSEAAETVAPDLLTHLNSLLLNSSTWTYVPWTNSYVYIDGTAPTVNFKYEFEKNSRLLKWTNSLGESFGIQLWSPDGTLYQIEDVFLNTPSYVVYTFEAANDMIVGDPGGDIEGDEIYVTSYLSEDASISIPEKYMLNDVLSYSRIGLTDYIGNEPTSLDRYITGEKGIWRINKTYQYYGSRENAYIDNQTTPGSRVDLSRDGVMTQVPYFELLPEADLSANKWIKTSEVTKLDAYGNAIESKDYFNRYTSVLFGDEGRLVKMQAKNAESNQIYFDDYEEQTNEDAHTGKYSKLVAASGGAEEVDFKAKITNTTAVDYKISFWIKLDNTDVHSYPLGEFADQISVSLQEDGAATLNSADVQLFDMVEGWQKCELVYPYNDAATDIKLKIVNNTSIDLYLDDLKIIPSQAVASCYVYDAINYQLKSTLDENHYATFYSYDEQGNLFLIKKETAEGVKMIQESRKNIKR